MSDKDDPRACCETPLERAEADLAAAKAELTDAEREVGKAESEIKEAIQEEEHCHEFSVEVLYDGVKKKFEVRPEETVKTLLDKAINAFGPLPNPHMLSLYKDGEELGDQLTIKAAGIKPCEMLLLRPSKVKGGA
jgi:hypothetical protein